MNRKLGFFAKDLSRLGVVTAGIQETRWFGNDIWTADGYTLLHSGRQLPDENEPQVRNEGMGILLDRHATVAWKNVGENGEAVSSQVVSVRIQVMGKERRPPGGSRKTSCPCMSVVSAHAQTANAPLGVKAKFFDGQDRTQWTVYQRGAS